MKHLRSSALAPFVAALLFAFAAAPTDDAWAAKARPSGAEKKRSSGKRRPAAKAPPHGSPRAPSSKASPKASRKPSRKPSSQSSPRPSPATGKRKLARPGAPKEEGRLGPKATAAGETAFRTVGVGVFAEGVGGPGGFAGEGAVRFCEDVAAAMSQKSYFLASCLKQTVVDHGPALVELAKKRGVDALLLGEVSAGGVTMRLVSGRSGRVVGTFKSPAPKTFDDAGRGDMVAAAVDGFVGKTPFRGFITRVTGETVEVNLGENHGVTKGTMLKVFEFSGVEPNLGGEREAVGVVEVTGAIGPDASVGRIVDRRGAIGEYSKIAHKDAEPPSQIATVRVTTEPSFWVSFGPELLTIESEIKGVANLNRQYEMKATPFVQVGMGGDRWFSNIWYGYASDDAETLGYFALQGAYQIRSVGGFKSGYTVSAGAWISQYSASVKSRNLTRVLEDSTRYSPFLELRYQKVLRPRFMVFVSAEGQYPLIATSQQTGQIPFSYGFGSTPGMRFNVNDWFSLEAGYRYQYLTLPLAGDKGTTETHSGYFLRGVFLL